MTAWRKRRQQYLNSKALWQRVEGIKSLEFFKSEENIARIKTFLQDPGYQEGEQNGAKVRYFHARDAAYRTLTYWGVKVEEPLSEEREQKKP